VEARPLSRIDATLKGALLTAVLVALLWLAMDVFLIVFAGVLLAVLLSSAGEWLARKTGLSYGMALAAVLLGILLALVLAGAAAAPSLWRQFGDITQRLPQAVDQLKATVREFPGGTYLIEKAPEEVQQLQAGAEGKTTTIAASLFGAIGTFVIILFVGIYLAADPKIYRTGLLRLFPLHKRQRVKEILIEVEGTLRLWMLGTGIAMLIVGFLTWVGLMLIGVPLALLFGVIAGLLDFIPNIGPILAAIPTLLITLTTEPSQAAWVALLYVCIQAMEGYLITPLVQQRAADLPPVITILAQVFMGFMAGPLGVALATPLAAAAIVVVRMAYVEDELEDRQAPP
jgi:predicted PurR-regulated permease PerM